MLAVSPIAVDLMACTVPSGVEVLLMKWFTFQHFYTGSISFSAFLYWIDFLFSIFILDRFPFQHFYTGSIYFPAFLYWIDFLFSIFILDRFPFQHFYTGSISFYTLMRSIANANSLRFKFYASKHLVPSSFVNSAQR